MDKNIQNLVSIEVKSVDGFFSECDGVYTRNERSYNKNLFINGTQAMTWQDWVPGYENLGDYGRWFLFDFRGEEDLLQEYCDPANDGYAGKNKASPLYPHGYPKLKTDQFADKEDDTWIVRFKF